MATLERCQCFRIRLAGGKKIKPSAKAAPARDTPVRQKRVNLAEGTTSIIGQRLGFSSSWIRAGADIKSASPGCARRFLLMLCGFSDAEHRQRHRRLSKQRVLHASAPKQLQARKLVRAWDKLEPVAERDPKRGERNLIFRSRIDPHTWSSNILASSSRFFKLGSNEGTFTRPEIGSNYTASVQFRNV